MRKASTRLPEQGTQTPSPAPDLIPAEPKHQPRTHIAIGTANGGTSMPRHVLGFTRVPITPSGVKLRRVASIPSIRVLGLRRSVMLLLPSPAQQRLDYLRWLQEHRAHYFLGFSVVKLLAWGTSSHHRSRATFLQWHGHGDRARREW
jgi:hypothetical protein